MSELSRKLAFYVQWACVLVALWFINSYIFVALKSLNYPFALEWMEGQSIDVIARIVAGKPVYVEPTLEYIPFLYTPLFYYVSAVVSLFTGVDFFAGRFVSFLASLGSGVLAYQFVRKEGGDWKSGVCAAGVFYSTYTLSGRWFELARVDSLFLFLLLSAIFLFTYYRGEKSALVAGLLFAAAFFTKQLTLVIAAPILLSGLYFDARRAVWVGCIIAVAVLSGIFSYNLVSDGWFSFFVFRVPSGHPLRSYIYTDFWIWDIWPNVNALLIVAVVYVRMVWKKDRQKGRRYLALVFGFVGAAWVGRIHTGGFDNVLMPAHMGLALIAGMAMGAFEEKNKARGLILISLMLIGQMLHWFYYPEDLAPSERSLEVNTQFLEQIAKIDGDVFMPDIQFVQTRIGKKSYAFGMPAEDIFDSNLGERSSVKVKLRQELGLAIMNHQFAAIIPGQVIFRTLPNINKYYRVTSSASFYEGYAFDSRSREKKAIFTPKPDNTSVVPERD